MRQRLSAAQVAELAELLEDAPRRAGVVDEVLQAAAKGRGMTLRLADPGFLPGKPVSNRGASDQGNADAELSKRS